MLFWYLVCGFLALLGFVYLVAGNWGGVVVVLGLLALANSDGSNTHHHYRH